MTGTAYSALTAAVLREIIVIYLDMGKENSTTSKFFCANLHVMIKLQPDEQDRLVIKYDDRR